MTSMTTVAFQGLHGTFAEGAARELFANTANINVPGGVEQLQLIPIKGHDNLLARVETGAVDYAIVPIENSHSGTLHATYDLLLKHKNVHIVGEYVYHEPNCLMAPSGVALGDIREVKSHPHVLDQCMSTLASKLDVGTIIFSMADDTAGAAAAVQASGRRDFACIGSERACALYGLHILLKGVEDSPNCATRYYLLSRKTVLPEAHTEPRTAFVVSLRNSPGTLFRALSCFALRDINVSKFESRPTLRGGSTWGGRPWQYHMFIEVDGTMADTAMQHALRNLEEFAQSVRLLGSFPRFRPPTSTSAFGAFSM